MKKSNKRRIIVPILIVVFSALLTSCILFFVYTLSGNYINITKIDDSAKHATLTDASNSNVIIVNGIVLGASKDNKWISAEKFYEANASLSDIEVNVFSQNSQYGTFKTASLKKYNNSVIYTTLAKENIPVNYLALTATNSVRKLPGMTKIEPTQEDKDYVKDAIGSYDLLNGSVKILEVYASNIQQVTDRIICAVCETPNILGAYSAVVYVSGTKSYLVKYAYVRDTENSDRWPIYSLKFVMDVNSDSKPEIILQETTGNDTAYSVLELREKNTFYEVLRSTIHI